MADAARVYAEALFEVGRDKGKLDTLQQQLTQFADEVDRNRELQVFFFSPYLSTAEKQEGIERAISGAEPELVNFLELLVDKHRMPEIFRIRREFEELWKQENRRIDVTVTSAVELDKSVIEHVGTEIEKQTDRKVELHSEVDPTSWGDWCCGSATWSSTRACRQSSSASARKWPRSFRGLRD